MKQEVFLKFLENCFKAVENPNEARMLFNHAICNFIIDLDNAKYFDLADKIREMQFNHGKVSFANFEIGEQK